MKIDARGSTIPEVQHHDEEVNGTTLHLVTAGSGGTPILLVHGFPESWWAFHKLIPLLTQTHRVVAVDLRGFGDSAPATDDADTATSAEDLHQLIGLLEMGPVHLVGQDISGGVVHRLAAEHPEDLISLTVIEAGLAGFGGEALADASHGGAWYIGALVAPNVPELVLAGKERQFIAEWLYPSYDAGPPTVTDQDADEFVRTYAREGGFRGATGLYTALLNEGDETKAIAARSPLMMPVMAVGSASGPFTAQTMSRVTAGEVTAKELKGVGHYVAMEAPDALANLLLDFTQTLDED